MFAVRLDQLARYLVPSSILYLGLPYVFFCVGWLKWYWALLLIGLLVMALLESTWLTFRPVAATDSSSVSAPDSAVESPLFTFRHLLLLLLSSIVWLSLAGVGEIGFQRGDWVKHESILRDLIDLPWPVVYDFYGDPVPLVYYIAFYLPAAVVGKIAGWAEAQIALFIWTFVGLSLAMLWFWVLVRKLAYWVLLIFIFFSGLDVLGRILASWLGWATESWERIERWGIYFEYSSNASLLYWVPNQALTGWIAVGLTLYAILHLRQRRITWLPLGLSLLGTPFVTVGLVPYLLAEFLGSQEPLGARLRRYLSWSNLCGLLLLFGVGLFYLSKLDRVSSLWQAELPHGFFLSTYSGRNLSGFGVVLLFGLVEVGLYALLLFKSMKFEQRLWRWFFAATLVYLSLLPLYTFGIYNDLAMRGSIPALFCLAVLVARAIGRKALDLPLRLAIGVALVLGAGTAIIESRYQIVGIYQKAMGVPREGFVEARGILEVYQGLPTYFLQYVGSYQSPFFQHFAKEQAWTSYPGQKSYIAFADNKILFESYQLSKESGLKAGEEVQIMSNLHVFFTAIEKNYHISLRLVAEEGDERERGEQEVWKEQGWPENRPTSIWAPTVQWFDTRTITIPADTPAGIYRLDLSFVDPESQELLPAFAMPVGKYLGEMVPIGYVTVGEIESRPTSLFAQPAELDGKVALLGVTPAPKPVVVRGESLNLELFWQTMTEMDSNYTGFVHLIDEDGALIAQHDHLPRNGFLPTTIWKEGLVVADGYTIVVPEDANPGVYTLVAGMYDLENGARLQVWQNGINVGDSVQLAQIEVQ